MADHKLNVDSFVSLIQFYLQAGIPQDIILFL